MYLFEKGVSTKDGCPSVKSRKKRKRRESPVLPFKGRRKIKHLTVTDDLRKKFQEGNRRKQKLPVRTSDIN